MTNVDKFFRSHNYLFSTKAEGREETLYFEDRATKQTGRLRQQHPHGPRAKIDKKPKIHRFLSKMRFDELKEWHEQHKHRLPKFHTYEKRLKSGKYHVEFAYDGNGISGWHPSEGTTTMRKHGLDLDHYIRGALKNILGIRSKK